MTDVRLYRNFRGRTEKNLAITAKTDNSLAPCHIDLLNSAGSLSVRRKAFPGQTWTDPDGFRRLRLPGFSENRHMKVKMVSGIRLYIRTDFKFTYSDLS